MRADSSHDVQEVRDLIEHQRFDALRRRVAGMDPADLADLVEDIGPDERDRIFDILDVDQASDVLVELDPRTHEEVVGDMPVDRMARVADQMAPDDAADFLADLDDGQRLEVLANMQEAGTVSQLLPYPEDSAGHVMTTEFFALPGAATVEEARRRLAEVDASDPVFYLFVVDSPEVRRLTGTVPVNDLINADPRQTLAELADAAFPSCQVDDDQEEVARVFRKYDLWVLPVLDRDGRILGRITVDDIIDVLHEENDEDIAHIVGAPDIDEEEESPLRIVRMRLPWLMITMLAGMVNSIIIQRMLLQVNNIVALTIFVPAIMAMGGNTGMQSSTIAVRGIALGMRRYRKLFRIVGREIVVGTSLGVCCGVCAGSSVFVVLSLLAPETAPFTYLTLAFCVALAMCLGMTFAAAFGSLFPVLLHRLRIDPAVASGPFVTTCNDLSSAVIYFLICLLLLRAQA